MEIFVDEDVCVGCGLCVAMNEKLFRLNKDWKGRIYGRILYGGYRRNHRCMFCTSSQKSVDVTGSFNVFVDLLRKRLELCLKLIKQKAVCF